MPNHDVFERKNNYEDNDDDDDDDDDCADADIVAIEEERSQKLTRGHQHFWQRICLQILRRLLILLTLREGWPITKSDEFSEKSL